MKLSTSLVTAAFAAFGATGAQAVTLTPLDLSSGSAFFGNTPAAGGFSDTVSFTVPTASTANASVVSVLNGTQDIDFTSVVLNGPGGSFNFLQVSTDTNLAEVWALPAVGVALTAGTYVLTITGTNSSSIASYVGNVAVTPVTPVPEPGSMALMLAGIAAVGTVVRRRRA